jgi:Spy/CpxP family protein refolding chaperone
VTVSSHILALSLVALAACAAVAPATAQEEPSPYVGPETREIKALSPEQIEDLLAGEGLGYALAAELNHYPGPRHVLALADSLELSPAQRTEVEAIGDRMREKAITLGQRMVDTETALDRLFASAEIDAGSLERQVAEIARLEGELRAAHLTAHLETRSVLSEEQVAAYDRLRGYGAGHGEVPQGGPQHQHPPD